MFMLGCPLQAAYPVVPLAERHAVSVGMITVHDQACFGVYADRQALPDADMLARDIDGAITELLLCTHQVSEPAGSLLQRAHAAAVRPAAPARPEPTPVPAEPPSAPVGERPATEPAAPADPVIAQDAEHERPSVVSPFSSLRSLHNPR